MSAYPPPKENLPIYNPTDFEYENFPLTINDARDFFLEYPTAQGAETLAEIVVNGASTFNDVAVINDSLDIKQPTSSLNALNIENDNVGVSITATSKTSKSTSGLLTINGSSTANKENPIVEDGDSVVSSSIAGANDTGGLTLTQKSITGSGIRIANNKVQVFPGIEYPDGSVQTTASFIPNNYTYSEQILHNGTDGNIQSITIPANCIKCDIFTYGAGGSAGQTNYYGSYAVNGGSGGGASMTACYGIPIIPGNTLDMIWYVSSSGFCRVFQNGDQNNSFGDAHNGNDGQPGTSGGTGQKGVQQQSGGARTGDYPSWFKEGEEGEDGGSASFPNSNVPVGGANPARGGGQLYGVGWSSGGAGMGQRYSAGTGAGGSYNYPASPYISVGVAQITWYIKT